jgi:hypothetical protein
MKLRPLLRIHAALHGEQVLHGDLSVRDRPLVLLSISAEQLLALRKAESGQVLQLLYVLRD